MFSSSVTPTDKLSILYPLLVNNPDILLKTPERFSTNTDKTCLEIPISPFYNVLSIGSTQHSIKNVLSDDIASKNVSLSCLLSITLLPFSP